MSLFDQLTADLRTAREHLPLPALRRAIADLRRADESVLLAIRRANDLPDARDHGGAPAIPHATLARLGAATTHVETGAGLLMRAQDEVGAYLSAIGAGVARPLGEPPVGAAPAGPTPVGELLSELPVADAAATIDAWWPARVGMLTAERGDGCDDPARTGPELLARLVAAARSHDRTGVHAQLVGAGAALGSSLTSVAVTGIRRILTDVLGRPPTAR